MLNEFIVGALENNNDIQDLIGDRFYYEILPQDAGFPSLVFKLTADNTETFLDGERSSLIDQDIQFVFYTKSADDLSLINSALVSAMNESEYFDSVLQGSLGGGYDESFGVYSFVFNFNVWSI